MVYNIEDMRFLLSALIQILPTVLSITFIAFFALLPRFLKGVGINFYKRFRNRIITMIGIFFLAIALDIGVLGGLTEIKDSYPLLPILAVAVSSLAIFSLYYFLAWFILEIHQKIMQ